jgi:hypothetical protein
LRACCHRHPVRELVLFHDLGHDHDLGTWWFFCIPVFIVVITVRSVLTLRGTLSEEFCHELS